MLDMVYIPGGTFLMGSPDGQSVTIQPFFMAKTLITQAQWRAVAVLPKVERDLEPDPSNFKGAKRPVESVSWHDCQEFVQRLNGSPALRGGNVTFRLPSEAEWEYACRAGTTTPFYFGETITTDLANYEGNSTYGDGPKGEYRKQTTDVGSFPPNAFGLYDLHGNVWEWCQDVWHNSYNGAPTDGSAWEQGDDASRRLLRGGSWNFDPHYCRSAYRGSNNPDDRDHYIGVRVLARTQ